MLATICQAAADTFSPKVVRSAFSALRAMVHVWLPTSTPLVGADAAAAGIFLRFVWDTAAAACFNVCAAARFDFDDAAAGLAASEVGGSGVWCTVARPSLYCARRSCHSSP